MSQTVTTTHGDFSFEEVGNGERSIVFLHGGAANLRSWDLVTHYLADQYRCISIDLPAHGETTASHLPFEPLSRAILEITEKLSVLNAYLIGHSFGGLVAATTAVRQPDRVSGVMMVDSFLASREVHGQFCDLTEALDHLQNIKWPWVETRDLEEEVERCFSNLQIKRESEAQSKAMIRRGYRKQTSGTYIRYPRVQDEMKGVEANWSIDITKEISSVSCPLAIAIAQQGLPDLEARRQLADEIRSAQQKCSVKVFDCGHDIPGIQPKTLAGFIDDWISNN